MKHKLHFLLLFFLLAGCQLAPKAVDQPQKSLTFMAGYKPQANLPFVGVYVAQEKGFFADEKLQVTIQHSAGGGEHLQLLAVGKVDVTTQDAAILLKRRADPGLPLVSIALIGQQGQQAFVALADSGVKSPRDWVGKNVGYKGSPPPDLFALMAAAGVDQAKVNLVNVGFDPRALTEGLVDVYPVFKSNEPYLIQQWGYGLTMWEAADYGIPNLGLTYVTTPAIIEQDPDRMARFLRAALAGIEYARQHPDEAVEIVLKYAGEQADPAHMRYMLDTELADAVSPVTEAHGLGWQTIEQWQALQDMLVEYQAMEKPIDVEQAFTNNLLPQNTGP
ncbi:MAG: ABC transporter substrate-binding protein [Anaerolineae bacterium]|nr:ABC transporter substrate-binding protein [Anaerolineae bacterium]